MIKTGQLLKESREKQKISLSEVALSTKIKVRVLEAIEEGRVDDLPSSSFLKGFVRSYAKYLNIDINLVMSSFNEEMGLTQKVTRVQDVNLPSPPSWMDKIPFLKDRSAASKTISVVSIVILIFLIVGIKSIIDKYEKESTIPSTPYAIKSIEGNEGSTETANKNLGIPKLTTIPKSEVKTAEKTPTKVEEASTATASAENMEQKIVEAPEKVEVSAPVIAEPAKEESKPQEKVEPVAVVKEEPKPQEKAEPVAVVKEEPKPQEKLEPVVVAKKELPKPKPKPILAKPQEIIIEALDKVVIKFRVDDGSLERIKLNPEEIHTIKAQKSIIVDLSDGGAVNIVHNGRDKGVPGDLGQPVNVKFP